MKRCISHTWILPIAQFLVGSRCSWKFFGVLILWQGYYRAAHSLARTARNMSRQFWRPSTDSDGIPFETLCTFITALSDWRDQYLTLVGVPSNFEGEWDFVSVSAFEYL